MDEKVIEKQRMNEEFERISKEKAKVDKDIKKKREEKKITQVKAFNKKRIQKIKDNKKKSKKAKEKKKITIDNPNTKYKIPNIREIPANCKHLVKEHDVLYVVPGDGACGPNCGAALLFGMTCSVLNCGKQ